MLTLSIPRRLRSWWLFVDSRVSMDMLLEAGLGMAVSVAVNIYCVLMLRSSGDYERLEGNSMPNIEADS